VDFKSFKLTFLEGTTFKTKVNQRPLKPLQCQYLYERLNELEKAGIIRPIDPADIKAASPTVLAQKANGAGSLLVEELLHQVNNQCVQHGLPTRDDLPPRPPKTTDSKTIKPTPKWQCGASARISWRSTRPAKFHQYRKETSGQSNND
jgi:hypothetical protein